MDRKVVQDIVPTHKRTIRNIPTKKVKVEELDGEESVPLRRVPASSSISRSQAPRMTETPPPRVPPTRVSPPSKGGRRFPNILLTFLVVFIGIAVIAVAVSLLYSKAVVTITPKTTEFEVGGTYTAKKEAGASSTSLVYEALTVTASQTQNVPAADGPLIQTKTKGTVTLFNEQTTAQKIVAGTRLANSDGEIFRTSTTVTIPAGKAGAPGKIDVGVLADAAGASYNMSLSDDEDFTIVAYRGTPKYTTVYAQLKTALTGGFSGNRKSISAEVQKAAIDSLKESLETKLLEDVKAKIPEDSILYPSAHTIVYETPEPVSKDAQTADIVVKGTLHAAVLKKSAVLKAAATKELDRFPAPTYKTAGLEDLKFTLINSKDFSPQKGTPLIFSLKGPITLTGSFSEDALKKDLQGISLQESTAVFARYPSIANAYALITPFWIRSFPNSPEKIKIEMKK